MRRSGDPLGEDGCEGQSVVALCVSMPRAALAEPRRDRRAMLRGRGRHAGAVAVDPDRDRQARRRGADPGVEADSRTHRGGPMPEQPEERTTRPACSRRSRATLAEELQGEQDAMGVPIAVRRLVDVSVEPIVVANVPAEHARRRVRARRARRSPAGPVSDRGRLFQPGDPRRRPRPGGRRHGVGRDLTRDAARDRPRDAREPRHRHAARPRRADRRATAWSTWSTTTAWGTGRAVRAGRARAVRPGGTATRCASQISWCMATILSSSRVGGRSRRSGARCPRPLSHRSTPKGSCCG
jgi:hypothetical protein